MAPCFNMFESLFFLVDDFSMMVNHGSNSCVFFTDVIFYHRLNDVCSSINGRFSRFHHPFHHVESKTGGIPQQHPWDAKKRRLMGSPIWKVLIQDGLKVYNYNTMVFLGI